MIREFHENYYLKFDGEDCVHCEPNGRYCILCKFDEFLGNPNLYINQAYEKSKSKLANDVHYKDIEHDYKLRGE